jgi:LPXTG-motif cell wall-anchored protein
MKGKYFVAAGVAIIAAGIYFWTKRKKSAPQNTIPERENERHHLTNVFSKAKQVAVGN